MFTSSLTLSALTLTLIQSFAAAAPGYYPDGRSTTPLYTTSYGAPPPPPSSVTSSRPTYPTVKPGTNGTTNVVPPLYPTGSGAPYTPPSVTSSRPTYATPNPATNRTTDVVPPPYYTASTITSVLTRTKTLTWTISVPCTTVVQGSTSYYSTASLYTTYIPEYETMTVTENCGKNCYKPGPTPTSVYGPPGRISSTPGGTRPVPTVPYSSGNPKPTSVTPPAYTVTPVREKPTISASNPVYTLPTAYTCPPAVTVTEAYKTITVTVTAGPTASSAPTYGDCKPGMACYTYAGKNSTMSNPTYKVTGTVKTLPTGYHY